MKSTAPRRLLAATVIAFIAVHSAACTPGTAGSLVAKEPTLNGSELCRKGRRNPSPLVVEWSTSERAQFEALAKRGLIVVRYTGCDLEVLTQCRGPGNYAFTRITPKSETEEINGTDELYTKIPLGAAELKGQLDRSGHLVVESTIVGRYAAEKLDASESDLVGRCLGATHVVSGLTVGAFELSTGAAGALSADATAIHFGAGGSSRSSHRVLAHDGDVTACVAPPTRPPLPPPPPVEARDGGAVPESASTTAEPPPAQSVAVPDAAPAGCGALIRIDLAPLPQAEARAAAEDQAREADLAERRSSASTRRTLGYVAGGVGLGLGALGGTFMILGSQTNSRVQNGGLATANDIKDTESTGKTDNTLAWAFGIAGAALLGFGATLVIVSSPPPNPVEDAFITPRRRFVSAR